MGCSLEQYRSAIGKFASCHAMGRRRKERWRGGTVGRRGRQGGVGIPSFLLLLLLTVALGSQATSTTGFPGTRLLPGQPAGSHQSSSLHLTLRPAYCSLLLSQQCQVSRPPQNTSLASLEVARKLLLRAGVEANPGPYHCQFCREYTTDIEHNMSRHVKFYCPQRGDVPASQTAARATRATKRKRDEMEVEVMIMHCTSQY